MVTGSAGQLIPEDRLLRHIAYELQANWEFDHLRDILLAALWQFAVVATILLLLSVFLLVTLGSMPLARLSQHIDRLGRGAADGLDGAKSLLPLAEFDKVRSSLNDYHVRLTEGALALQDSEARMRAVLHNVVDAILTFNSEGIISSANPAVERIFGWTPDGLLDHQAASLFANLNPGELQRQTVRLDSDGEAAKRIELVGQHQDGSQFPVELTLSRLPLPDSESYIAVVADITERKAAEQRLMYLANYDALTGLPNRTLLRDRLEHAMLQADRSDLLVGVLFLDLDRFKTVNDTLGHHSGDQLLSVVADRLKGCVRPGDTVARLGGDEFMVVVEGVGHVEDASHVAGQIRSAFDDPILLNGREVFVTPSIGITLYPLDDSDTDALLRNADSAMYRAKELGGDGIQFFTQDLNERAAERLSLESSLRQALARDEFILHYQPRIDTATGVVVSAEALLRWNHPELGLVGPDRFIDILEEIGLIEPVGEWVLRTACAQAVAWRAAGVPPLRMAVNISPRQFRSQGLVEQVLQVLHDTGLPANGLELEITENVLVENVAVTREIIQSLSDHGVHIALDDFGTGYSALGYLRHFRIDTLKIDRSFITELPGQGDGARLVSALVAIARSLGLRVTAEGVETEAQLAFLTDLGCQEVQGFLYARALPPAEFEDWLASHVHAGVPVSR
jgi:diguanylate cyclase (GGDEF)-like protein/PAS domain S-box-containing protein